MYSIGSSIGRKVGDIATTDLMEVLPKPVQKAAIFGTNLGIVGTAVNYYRNPKSLEDDIKKKKDEMIKKRDDIIKNGNESLENNRKILKENIDILKTSGEYTPKQIEDISKKYLKDYLENNLNEEHQNKYINILL